MENNIQKNEKIKEKVDNNKLQDVQNKNKRF